MYHFPRYIPGLVIVVLYALIVLSPLASLALHSKLIAHVVTGECSSDCSVCGCSPERSANHTCCCWQKKRQAGHDEGQYKPACCKKNQSDNKPMNSFISSRPCNSGKAAALALVVNGDVFPYCFCNTNPVVLELTLLERYPDWQTNWPNEPPEPPPKISYST